MIPLARPGYCDGARSLDTNRSVDFHLRYEWQRSLFNYVKERQRPERQQGCLMGARSLTELTARMSMDKGFGSSLRGARRSRKARKFFRISAARRTQLL